jgi:XTP/dITP diphosphohydrolase
VDTVRRTKMAENLFPLGRLVYFATGNFHKYNEARKILAEHKIVPAMLRIDVPEIQDDNLENIAKASALSATEKARLPLIVEDAGLFIEELNGFPGPYSKYVLQTIGMKDILRLLEANDERHACFRSAVCYCSPKGLLKIFSGVVKGTISRDIRGNRGFGFDPIFVPDEKPSMTFGELPVEEKNKISHRSRALRRFAEWYSSTSHLLNKAFK